MLLLLVDKLSMLIDDLKASAGYYSGKRTAIDETATGFAETNQHFAWFHWSEITKTNTVLCKYSIIDSKT